MLMYAPLQDADACNNRNIVSSGAGFALSFLSVSGEKLFISIVTLKISTADQVGCHVFL